MSWSNLLYKEILFYLYPLFSSFENETAWDAFWASFGIKVSETNTEALTNLQSSVEKSAEIINALLGEDNPELTNGLTHVIELFNAIETLTNDSAIRTLVQGEADFFEEIFNSLSFQYLDSQQQSISILLQMLGVITFDTVRTTDPKGRGLDFSRVNFEWSRLGDLLKDSGAWALDVYEWGDDPTTGETQFQSDLAILNLGRLVEATGLSLTHIRTISGAEIGRFLQNHDGSGLVELAIPLLQEEFSGDFDTDDQPIFSNEAGFKLVPFGDLNKPTSLGLALAPYAIGNADGDFPVTDTLTLQLSIDTQATSGVYFTFTPAGTSLTQESSSVDTKFRTQLIYEQPDQAPFALLGNIQSTGLVASRFSVSAAGTFEPNFALGIKLEDLKASIDVGGDGFLNQLIDGNLQLGLGDLELRWQQGQGVHFSGGNGLTVRLPAHQTIGPLQLQETALKIELDDKGTTLSISVSASLSLGPFQAAVQDLGMCLTIERAANNKGVLGLYDIKFKFLPPSGIGMQLDAAIIKGGGFLYNNPDRNEYAGALELKFAGWGIKAIGVLTTKRPDGSDGMSLLLLIYADLPRIHIAFGIFFEGIGGVLGLHHGADINAIQAGIPSGALDDVLFPANPIANAPRIINNLKVIFPIRPNAFLIGPMFRLTWGTPAIGDIKLGLIFTIDNALGGDEPLQLNSIMLLGQLRIGLPEANNGAVAIIICDFFGYLDFVNKRFGFYARLRNSRLAGSLELTGSLVLQIDFGNNPSFVMAVGGFHPRFTDLPVGLPSALDRVGLRFTIGIVNVSVTCYIALTSATVQFGAEVKAQVKLGPVEADGWIGFDALIYYEPYFKFEFDFRAGFRVKFNGWDIISVTVIGTIKGPGEWDISGRFSFSILGFEISRSFHATWGDRAALAAESTNIATLLRAAFSNTDNWNTSLPAGVDTLVTLAANKGETTLLAHPLSTLRVTQKVAPFDLTLEKFGETQVDGPNRFELQQVQIGEQIIRNPTKTREHLARSNYVDLSEEQRLSQPSFELFDVGVMVGTEDYVLEEDAVTLGGLSYETKILEPDLTEPSLTYVLSKIVATNILTTPDFSTVQVQARYGSAAYSPLRQSDKLIPNDSIRVSVTEPLLTVVKTVDFSPDATTTLTELASINISLAEQTMGGDNNSRVVEAFELVNSR